MRSVLPQWLKCLPLILLTLSPSPAGAASISPGDIIVSGTGADGSTGLFRVDPVSGAQTLIASGRFGDFSMLGTSIIYALGAGAVIIEVDTVTGDQRVVTSAEGSGIAVDGAGRVFVLNKSAFGGQGAIFEIDPSTGSQSILTSGGFLASTRPPTNFTDMELGLGGDLIVLDNEEPPEGYFYSGEVWSVDTTTGAQTRLFSENDDCPVVGTCTYSATGLGVAAAPNGDIYFSNGTGYATGVLKIDAITGETSIAGGVTIHPPDWGFYDLLNTDIAILEDGTGYLIGGYLYHGVFVWDVVPQLNPDWSILSVGFFSEIQIAPAGPEIEVAPLTLDFGMVDLGSSSIGIVSASNVGDADLTIADAVLGTGSDAAFTIDAPTSFPAVVPPGATLDVFITFTPGSETTVAATLEISSNDADEPLVVVDLVGEGVPYDEQLMEILDFFDQAVAEGTLPGSGPGNSGNRRRGALRNMIEAAGDLIDGSFIDEACDQLLDAQLRTDGEFPPPDFVEGPSAPLLFDEIGQLRANLGCADGSGEAIREVEGAGSVQPKGGCGLGAELIVLAGLWMRVRRRRGVGPL